MRSETLLKQHSHPLEESQKSEPFFVEYGNVVTLKFRKFNFARGFIILYNLVSNSRLMIQTEFIRDTNALRIQCQLCRL